MDRLEDAPPVGGKPRLLDQVRNVIRRLHYSIRTEQTYVGYVPKSERKSGLRRMAALKKAA